MKAVSEKELGTLDLNKGDLSSVFEEACERNSDKTAVVEKEFSGSWKETSYKGLFEKSGKVASFFTSKGAAKGDKVAVFMENGSDWVAAFFGILRTSGICVPLNTDWDAEAIEHILEDCSSKRIITDKENIDKVRSLDISIEVFLKEDAIEYVPDEDQGPMGGEQKPEEACLLYTSGTTSAPKGVVLTHKNLLANVRSISELGMILHEDRLLSGLPLYHAYPLMVSMIVPILIGSTIIYLKDLTSESIGEALNEAEPTFFISVPQILNKMHKKIKDRIMSLPFFLRIPINSLRKLCGFVRNTTGFNLGRYVFRSVHKKMPDHFRAFATGGAKIEVEVERFLSSIGYVVAQGYGMTEASPVISYNPFDGIRFGSVGKALPGVDIKIQPVKAAENVGEILVRGENVMKGYYGKEDLTRETLKDGWLHTGDLGYLDDGYLFLTGRKKQVIVLENGKNIYPEHIEKVYTENLPIKEVCVIDVKTPETGKISLHAVVVPEKEQFEEYGASNITETTKSRFDRVSRNLGPNERVSSVTVTSEPLPRTSLGKIKRFKVKEEYAGKFKGEIQREPRKRTEKEEAFLNDEFNKRVISAVKEAGGAKEVYPGDLLEDTGVDSLGRMELANIVENRFSRKFPEKVFTASLTVEELAESLKEKMDESEDFSGGSLTIEDRIAEEPAPETLKKIDLTPGVFNLIGFWLFLLPIRFIFKVFYRFKVSGQENLPKNGPYIIFANHTSFFDAFLVACAMKQKPRLDLFFIGFRIFFEVPVIRNLVKYGRIIPVDFSEGMLEALKSARYVLAHKKGVCLFPEGERNNRRQLKPFKRGFGIVAKNSDAVMIPIYIKGAREAWPIDSKWPGSGSISVHIDEPVSVSKALQKGTDLGVEDESEAVSAGAREILKEKIDQVEKKN